MPHALSGHNNIPTVLVVFGATGDLMEKKIVPALFHLFEKGELPTMFTLVGFSRRELSSEQFRAMVADIITRYKGAALAPETLRAFCACVRYHRGFLQEDADYHALAGVLADIDAAWGVCSNKLFYVAVAPDFYETVFTHLASSGLTKPCSPEEGWTRIIVEKPFGKDAKTAERLDAMLGTLFKEVQIYRIDHYLAKEMIQNILAFRFSNNLFEETWNRKFIERIDIRLWEMLGVESRGTFYDGVGALRDVGQNHLLQMLAFMTMDHPITFDADAVREKRADILRAFPRFSQAEAARHSFRAQYDGYRDIAGVAPDSATETYFKVETALRSPRWEGVPVVLEGGKRIGEVKKEIVITFKHSLPCLCPPGTSGHYQNKIVISLEPKEGITIHFWMKKPGLVYAMQESTFDFLLRDGREVRQYVEEYEKLLLDCIRGDQTLFVSTDEVQAMWRFIDPITDAWEKNRVPLAAYRPDTHEAIEQAAHIGAPAHEETHKKEVGIIGLGKMGGNIARRLAERGWHVVGFNRSPEVAQAMEKEGVLTAEASYETFMEQLPSPRIVWLMAPAGKPVDDILFGPDGIGKFLKKGDIAIDGGNSLYTDSKRRFTALKKKGVAFLDVGTSGGPGGARNGASLMIGGERAAFKKAEHLLRDIAAKDSYQFFDGAGAGHFVKMVHNGIEYGMMQAIAEGFAIMKKAKYKLDLTQVTDIYNHGSVIESRLIGWLKKAFIAHGHDLKGVSGSVAHTGEGKWTVEAAQALKVKAKIIEGSFRFRVESEKHPDYTGKVLSALREQFGGHSIVHTKQKRGKK